MKLDLVFKHLICIKATLVLLLYILCSECSAQDSTHPSGIFKYKELNVGLSRIEYLDFPLPAAAFTWGQTHIYDNNFVLDYQAGVALPTVVTGKIGAGIKIKKSMLLIGVRPFPTFVNLQFSSPNNMDGYWVYSFGYNPINGDFGIRYNFNVGYRWGR